LLAKSMMQETALTRAFFEHRHDLLLFLKGRLHCTATADDLCQDIYLRLQGVGDDGTVENCRGYLFMMAANLIADTHRRETRRASLLAESRHTAWPTPEPLTPEEAFAARSEIDYLNRAVAELPALSRRIFHANRFEGRTQREIAADFELSLSAVEYHIRKVLDHLARARDEFHRQP
jgi:RNA polymerase sigma-70 factor (ECF subfamily)